jgi:hypothetical protein
VRVGIGRGVVEEGSGSHRACMQELGFGSRAPPVSRRLRQRRRPPQLPPVNEQGHVTFGHHGDGTSIRTRSREGEERSTATFSLAIDLPKGSGSPMMDSPRLHNGEALQVRGSGERSNGQQERFWEGDSVFILNPRAGCTVQLVGRDWRAWVVLLDGVVR